MRKVGRSFVPGPREVNVRRVQPSFAVVPEPPAAAPSPAGTDQELVDYSWSAFWPWARERGLNGPREIENLIGQQVAAEIGVLRCQPRRLPALPPNPSP